MRISSPPTINPCYYGIDTPTKEELIASAQSLEDIREYLGADSLAYLSQEGLYAFTPGDGQGFCDACFTGRYPVPLGDEQPSRQLHLFEARDRRER
jgi:amidophosphoribosyltransferase